MRYLKSYLYLKKRCSTGSSYVNLQGHTERSSTQSLRICTFISVFADNMTSIYCAK